MHPERMSDPDFQQIHVSKAKPKRKCVPRILSASEASAGFLPGPDSFDQTGNTREWRCQCWKSLKGLFTLERFFIEKYSNGGLFSTTSIFLSFPYNQETVQYLAVFFQAYVSAPPPCSFPPTSRGRQWILNALLVAGVPVLAPSQPWPCCAAGWLGYWDTQE